MYRVSLLRSTPFRLALTFSLLFIVAFLITGAVTYALFKRELGRALDVSVHDTYAVVASTYSSDDLEDLIAAVNTYSTLNSSEGRVFLLVDANGRRLAGNVNNVAVPDNYSDIDARPLGFKGDDRIRIFAGTVGGNRLLVGQSYAETNDLEHIALMSFGWASALIVALAFGGGILLARRAQHRLDGIAQTMADVSNGSLSSRIPLHGNGDDIDVLSSQMNQALDRLSGLVEGMRQVSADIAHDLKTPLNRLRMTIERIQQRARDEDLLKLVDNAREESDRINATFEALLRISQIEAGARKARFVPVDLLGVMATIAEIYVDVAEDNGQRLTLASPVGTPAMVNGDRELLTQLFVNLVENAITHCPPDTEISMVLKAGTSGWTVIIADNGPGIAATERELVFRRLYRLDKSRTTPGSGLGLSLVRAIADLHGATVSLEDHDPGLRVVLHFNSWV
ncbi:HAMP domain-containing sensor histidine kinase [Rhizobium sp. BK251]|uniref:HAMP domain-containing sensor histidine kinase n=1 Tax=Rhizobium sp. BK251 TaxID=2512125 RepID=UPI00104307F2|nr:HAMP domain-containing sensor histidine kinase [Rhizobium sp. BK251]TCL69430.1 signal transduction histidine kinase [Rhizobium sp. BK251]